MSLLPTISYCIPVCNEFSEIQQLINQIKQYIQKDDEIIILFDTENGTQEVKEYLDKINIHIEFEGIEFHRIYHKLNKDFATHKNFLLKHASKDYSLLCDSDELLGEELLINLKQLIQFNPEVDVFLLNRENYVEGITQEYIQQMGWRLDEKERINWPDSQERIIKNKQGIQFQGKVHERLTGYKTISQIPINQEGWGIIHKKTFQKQQKQNQLYGTI